MRYILSAIGDKMENDEVDEIIKEIDSEGMFKYEPYVIEKLAALKK